MQLREFGEPVPLRGSECSRASPPWRPGQRSLKPLQRAWLAAGAPSAVQIAAALRVRQWV